MATEAVESLEASEASTEEVPATEPEVAVFCPRRGTRTRYDPAGAVLRG